MSWTCYPLCVLPVVVATLASAQCLRDCSLNGVCSTGNICECEPAWMGEACDILNIQAASKDNGYINSTETSWGGYPLFDVGTNHWHLFAAQMEHQCGLGSWKTNSKIVRATSAGAGGPYNYQEDVLLPFAHNPTIRRAPDGTFLLYYIGGWKEEPLKCSSLPTANFWTNSRPNCTSGATKDPPDKIRVGGDYKWIPMNETSTTGDCIALCCQDPQCQAFSFNNPQPSTAHECEAGKPCCLFKDTQPPTQSSSCTSCITGLVPAPPSPESPTQDGCGPSPLNSGCGISLGHSSSLMGPWTTQFLTFPNQNESKIFDCAHTNPAPWLLPNGTVVMAFNAGYCHGHTETIGIAVAPHWSGPYNVLTREAIFPGPHSCEDPFLWKDERGWHLLGHNFGKNVGLYAHSTDLLQWVLSPNTPYNETVFYTDGTTESNHVERPQILFDRDGTPLYLINGAQPPRPHGGLHQSWTLFRPLNH